MYDEDGFPIEFTEIIAPDAATAPVAAADDLAEDAVPHVPMREVFPPAGADLAGATSDGWEFRTFFSGSNLARVFDMVRQFLREEGYADVPLPASADELRLFKRPRPGQLQLFGEAGYIHNPIKIIFPSGLDKRKGLILCIYNEKMEGHLLRFHSLR